MNNTPSPIRRQVTTRALAGATTALLALGGVITPTPSAVAGTPPAAPSTSQGGTSAPGPSVGPRLTGESTQEFHIIDQGVGDISYKPSGSVKTGNDGETTLSSSKDPDGNVSVIATTDLGMTQKPAAWFNTHTVYNQPAYNSATKAMEGDAWATTPSELSFAASGVLTIDGAAYNVNLGLGRKWNGARNWWIGGAATPNEPGHWEFTSVTNNVVGNADGLVLPGKTYEILLNGDNSVIVAPYQTG